MAEETQKKEIPLKSDIEKGLRLKEFRKNFPGKMTQKDFGDSLGISQSMLSSYESGIYPIPKFIKNLLQEKFRMNVVWLDTGEGGKYLDDVKFDLESIYDRLNPENQNYAYELIKRLFVAQCHQEELDSL